MNQSDSERMDGRMNEWIRKISELNEWMNLSVTEWMDEWMNEWMNEIGKSLRWMNEWMNESVSELENKLIYERVSQWMNGWLH